MGKGPAGELYLAWQGNAGVFVAAASSPGEASAWSPPIQVSTRHCRTFGPVLAPLPEGRIALAYSDAVDDQQDLFLAELHP